MPPGAGAGGLHGKWNSARGGRALSVLFSSTNTKTKCMLRTKMVVHENHTWRCQIGIMTHFGAISDVSFST